MKLGVSYNIFSGLEMLEHSINSIRDHVDHINVVYQEVSNVGIVKPEIHDFVKGLKGKIDSAILYTPQSFQNPKANETRKRNIGLSHCKQIGCTHFMSMDADEIYTDQFIKAKEIIEKGNYDSSACKMQTYYKTPQYKVDPPEEYYVPFIYKIDKRMFQRGMSWPLKADSSRKMAPGHMKTFSREELEMHHMSYVRNDIRDKLYNSSSGVNFKDRMEDMAVHHDNWQYPQQAYLGGSGKRLMNVVKTNVFDFVVK